MDANGATQMQEDPAGDVLQRCRCEGVRAPAQMIAGGAYCGKQMHSVPIEVRSRGLASEHPLNTQHSAG